MRARSVILNAGKSLVEFLFPSTCPLCHARVETHGELCADCWANYHWIMGAKCPKCGAPHPVDFGGEENALCPSCVAGKCRLDWIRGACVYDDVSRAAMLPFKHGGRVAYARFMSRAMIWAMRDVDADFDIVMPVPLAYWRAVHRTYNQATLLARPIARASGAKLDLNSVRRKYREDMGHKNARQRADNIRGVFHVVHPERIRGKKILLVDDVMTTGATFYELRRVLMRAGAAAVYGVTFCRVSRTA